MTQTYAEGHIHGTSASPRHLTPDEMPEPHGIHPGGFLPVKGRASEILFPVRDPQLSAA